MKAAADSPSRAAVGLLVALALVGATGCEEFVGVEPPLDRIYFPIGVAVHPEGRYVYVVNSNFDVRFSEERGGSVSVVDTDTLQILPESTIRIGSFGGQMILSADARFLFVAVRGDDSVYRIEVSDDGRDLTCLGAKDALQCRIGDLSDDPFALAHEVVDVDLDVGGAASIDLLTVTYLQTNSLSAISFRDEDTSTLAQVTNDITAGGAGLAIHPRTGNYYVVGRFDDFVRMFVPVIGREGEVAGVFSLDGIPLPNPTGTYDSRSITFNESGDRAYVSSRNPHSVLVLDTSALPTGGGARNELIGQIDLNREPEALAIIEDEGVEMLYVLEFGSSSITVVDPVNLIVVDRFFVGDGPAYMAFDPSRHQRLYVTLFSDDSLGIVDLDPTSRRYRQIVAKVR